MKKWNLAAGILVAVLIVGGTICLNWVNATSKNDDDYMADFNDSIKEEIRRQSKREE